MLALPMGVRDALMSRARRGKDRTYAFTRVLCDAIGQQDSALSMMMAPVMCARNVA